LLHNPSAITAVLDNFQPPADTRQKDQSGLADRFLAGLELLDENWSNSQQDGAPAISAVSKPNDALADVFSVRLADRSFGEDGIDSPVFDKQAFLLAAYVSQSRA
jgi:hypothetical protein